MDFIQITNLHNKTWTWKIFLIFSEQLSRMEWFNGGVGEAIAAAKAKKAIFVVVVKGVKLMFVNFWTLTNIE